MIHINYLAVLLAAIANFVIGFIFHSPPIGKLWMKLANIKMTGKEKMSDMVPQMIKNLVANFVFAIGIAAAYALAITSSAVSGSNMFLGMHAAIAVWLLFLVPTSSVEVIWMGKSYKLWLYEIGVSLITCIAMGAIIAAM